MRPVGRVSEIEVRADVRSRPIFGEIGREFGKDIYPVVANLSSTTGHCRSIRMPECDYCGGHVSERFARVFADERGRVFACPKCSANAGIAEAARRRTQDA